MNDERVILVPDDSAQAKHHSPDGVDFRVAAQLGHRNPVAEVEECCWPGCTAARYDAPDAPPVCGNHMVSCAVYISDSMAALLDSRETPGAPVPARLVGDSAAASSLVYYVRIGDLIKIGTTTNLPARLQSLSIDHDPGALLATEPGGRELEATRHAEFARDRVHPGRELFTASVRLIDHIRQLRREVSE